MEGHIDKKSEQHKKDNYGHPLYPPFFCSSVSCCVYKNRKCLGLGILRHDQAFMPVIGGRDRKAQSPEMGGDGLGARHNHRHRHLHDDRRIAMNDDPIRFVGRVRVRIVFIGHRFNVPFAT